MPDPDFFEFEADFISSLRCIPLKVRLKLDTCGVKLKLNHWQQFTQAEKQQLVSLPCEQPAEIAHYRRFLQNLVIAHTGQPAKELAIDPAPAWLVASKLPLDVINQAAKVNQTITLAQWSSLTPLQRFALIKLSRPSHENRNFLPALKEFNLL